MLVYDLAVTVQDEETVRKHLKELAGWNMEVECLSDPDIPKILVANKLDKERTICPLAGQKLAREWKVPYFEVSAKNDIRVNQAFETITRMAIKYQKGQLENAEDIKKLPLEVSCPRCKRWCCYP